MILTRRHFLKSTGALAVYLGVTPFNLLAEEPSPTAGPLPVKKGKTLVIVFLRGGADGLNLVVPYKDPFYSKIRRNIEIASPTRDGGGALDLDGFFGLHPRLAGIHPFFEQGLAVAAHAVGHDRNTRSHFEEQDVWETGVTGNTINSDGWVNRHLATSTGHGPIRAVAIGDSLPRIMHGPASAIAISGVDDLALPDTRTDKAKLAAALEHAYRKDAKKSEGEARDLLGQSGKTTLDGIEELSALIGKEYKPAAAYPATDVARQLMQAARLIKANVGLEVAEIDYGGWDTHQFQGGGQGQFAELAGGLGDALAAFMKDLGDKRDDVLVVTLSDFGRTAEENGTQGTDHGWASCMFAMGGPVKAAKKKVISEWPGLAPDQLHEKRDLMHTTDFRDILAEMVREHLGNPKLEAVLPQHEFRKVGICGG